MRPTAHHEIALAGLLALVAGAGCADDDDFASADDDTTASGDDDAVEDDPVYSGEPPPETQAPVRIDAVQGTTPFVLALGGDEALVFFHEGDTGEGALVVRRATADPAALGPPVSIADGLSWPHAVRVGSTVWVTGAAGYAVETWRSEDDGETWAQVDTIAGSDGSCDGRLPSVLVDDGTAEPRLLLAYTFHDGLFGCMQTTRWSHLADGAWSEPAVVGNGLPTGVGYGDGTNLVALTHFGLHHSADGGETYQEVPGGDLTSTDVGGTGLALAGDGMVLGVRSYTYANEVHLSLIRVDPDDGAAVSPWSGIQAGDDQIHGGCLARAGEVLVASWLEARSGEILGSYARMEAFARVSRDGGLSWSDEAAVSVSEPGEQVGELALAVQGDRMWSAYTHTDAPGAPSIYLVVADIAP